MKKSLLLLLSCFFSIVASAQTEPANYKTGVAKFTRFYNANAVDSIFNMFSTKMQSALPIEKTKAVSEQLQTQLGNIETTDFKGISNGTALYKTTFSNGVFALKMSFDGQNKMSGLLVQPYQEEKVNVVDAGLTETPLTVISGDATLSGAIITPENSTGKIPVVLIIAGSGPTDRNGNGLGFTVNSYFILANALGKNGIASLRYDKRGSGQTKSTKTEAQLSFDDFVNDAAVLIRQLKSDPRFSKVIVLGHSEGSLVGMLAAERAKADGFISAAGASEAVDKLLAVQLKSQTPAAYKVSLGRLDSLSKGLMVKAADDDRLFRPSAQHYMISWMKYNPQTEIKKLKIPVLLVQGNTDLQISVADAEQLKKAKPDAKLVLIEGMNHVLKDAPADREKNAATYNQPLLPLNSNLVTAVVDFVKVQ